MRLWLLGALAAVLAGVALAGADPGAVREAKKADGWTAKRKDKSRPTRPAKPCPGCFTPMEDTEVAVRARRQVEKQPRARPRPTRRPGYLTVLRPGKVPDVPERARRQVEKQPPARPRPTRRPGYLTLLRPGKVEAPPLDGRTRRDVRRPRRPGRRPRPRPRPKPTTDSPLISYMIPLSAPFDWRPEGPDLQDRARREAEGTPPKPPRLPCSGCYSPLFTHKEGRPRARREDGQPLAAKHRAKQGGRRRLHCAGCFSSLTLQSHRPPGTEQESRSAGGASGN
ncbi:uncharacterized protein LOC106732958 isoform X2 [Pelodiscus sinensis]|uniref:uncharacterized protein LOC106732958 isoform X2 n=1 Tax=Pelodiscus sinensis TaxID=13735 RepID=UPI003F6D957E